MTATAQAPSKVLAAWFKDLSRWDYGFFKTVTWAWPEDSLFPLGSVLSRKQVEVAATTEKTTLPIIEKISFGGQISVTGIDARADYKGRLFWAETGDLIYSKIRVKQGSLAVVPSEFDRLAVSSEYPVYRINEERADSTFLTLALKSRSFRALFEGLSHGGATKTRIPPTEFERQLIPLPPLAEQKAIVTLWRKAQDEITSYRERVAKQKALIESRFFADLGLRSPDRLHIPKAFAVIWEDFSRWGVRFNQLNQAGADIVQGKYPIVAVDSLLKVVQYGTSEKANSSRVGVPVLRIGNIKEGELDLSDLKYIFLPKMMLEGLLLQDGDVLIIRTSGSRDLVGTCAVFRGKEELIFASYLIRLRFDAATIVPEFASWFLNSSLGRQQIDAVSRQIMQNNINSEELRGLQIPLPPLDEQKRIMERVAAGRDEIARERVVADCLARDINAEIEALILGTKKVGEL